MSADVSNSAAADGADVSNSAAAADITLNTGAIQKQCATCNALENKLVNKFKTCSKCMNVWYCSLECQKNDWKKHKPICTQYCKWVVSLEKDIQTYRIKAPIGWNKQNTNEFNNNVEMESMAILDNPTKMSSLFSPEHISAVISDKSNEGQGRIKELLNILSFKPIKNLKYPPLILIEQLIKAAEMEDNAAISRINDEGITTKGKLNGVGERKFLNKFGILLATYKGNFVNDSPSFGEFTNNVDNSIYVGEFNNDKKNGQGTLTYLDGSYIYTGGFSDDKKHGQGTIVNPLAKTTIIGTWNNDKFDGEIRFINNNTKIVFVSFYVDGVEDESKRQIIKPNGGKTRRKKTNQKSRKIKRLTTRTTRPVRNKQFRRV
jgi:hypothetical protein